MKTLNLFGTNSEKGTIVTGSNLFGTNSEKGTIVTGSKIGEIITTGPGDFCRSSVHFLGIYPVCTHSFPSKHRIAVWAVLINTNGNARLNSGPPGLD